MNMIHLIGLLLLHSVFGQDLATSQEPAAGNQQPAAGQRPASSPQPRDPKADSPPRQSPELPGRLDRDLLEGLDLPVPTPSEAAPARPGGDTRGLPEGEDLGQRGGTAATLEQIRQLMEQSHRRLEAADTSAPTQQVQEQIVSDLGRLIEELQSAQSVPQGQPQPGGEPQPGGADRGNSDGTPDSAGTPRPSEPNDLESTDRLGESDTVTGAPEAVQQVLAEVWGHLPARMRQQLQAAAGVEFLPEYQQLIEDYYKRLAEAGRRRP